MSPKPVSTMFFTSPHPACQSRMLNIIHISNALTKFATNASSANNQYTRLAELGIECWTKDGESMSIARHS